MRSFAERTGLPADAVSFFEGIGAAQLLLARRSS
jgi:hypothetical protein